MDAAIVSRANELVELSAKGDDLVAACAAISPQEEEDLKDAVSCTPLSSKFVSAERTSGRDS